ncbi:transcription factor grauzone [Drosophila persimilis]|uniref:transcription factor grauzone n=1 Tax=Drosophila persimilis TaxID=7234 RepID=UPI000F0813B8|nr:transcription factor grauzone [Drosophila persimilis]
MMICRLCLEDTEHSVPIFDQDGEAVHQTMQQLAELIEKHLQLVLAANDAVSTCLCGTCWQQLSSFEQFCCMVADKQRALQLKIEVSDPEPEPGLIVWNTESPIESKIDFDGGDIKDHILCEPVIDALAARDDKDNDSDDGDRFETDFEPNAIEPDPVKPKNPGRGRPRKTLQKNSQLIKKKYEKHKQTKAELTGLTLRESRARARDLRRKPEAVSSGNDSTPPDPEYTLSVPTRASGNRGRPKTITKCKRKHPTVEVQAETEPSVKRNSIKEMDDFIAANVKLDCCLCAAPLADFNDLKRHFRVEHNILGYVKCCNNRYKKRTLYVDHLHCHKDPQYFSCQPCRKNFLNRNSQVMHMLRFHSEQQELVHECSICEARFAKKFLLTMHLKGHKGTERPEVCDTCGKTFRTKFELSAHVKRMHAADFTPIICDICGTHFRSKANFLIHKKALHPDGPVAEVQCTLCGRWLRDERSLRKHLARHDDRDNQKKYRCSLCNAEKSSRAALSSHMRYHHSAKRHKCSLCDKEFKLPRALVEHMATHTGIDLYSCQFCTRTFKSHANMHNHKKKMHPNEWVRKYSQPTTISALGSSSGHLSSTEAEAGSETVAVAGVNLPAPAANLMDDPSVGETFELLSNSSACPTLD